MLSLLRDQGAGLSVVGPELRRGQRNKLLIHRLEVCGSPALASPWAWSPIL